jgi:hypothetical protein
VIRLKKNEGFYSLVETARLDSNYGGVKSRSQLNQEEDLSTLYSHPTKILLSVATVVHPLQRLDDPDPNRDCLLQRISHPLQRLCTYHNFKFLRWNPLQQMKILYNG